MTPRLEIAPDFDHRVCEGTLAALDGHVAFIEEGLARPLPPGQKIRLYWITDGIERWCDAPGCFYPGTRVIFAGTESTGHEMVHAVFNAIFGNNAFFEEGLAELFSGRGASHDPRTGSRPSPSELLDGSGGTDYVVASHFLHYLYRAHDPATIRRLADAVAREESTETLGHSIFAEFGTTFEELEADYLADASPYYRGLTGLGVPDAELDGAGRLEVALDCDDTSTRGPLWDDQPGAYRVFRWPIDQASTWSISVAGEAPGRLDVITVGNSVLSWERPVGASEEQVLRVDPDTTAEVMLPAGDHLLVFSSPDYDPVTLTATLVESEPPYRCGAGAPTVLGSEHGLS